MPTDQIPEPWKSFLSEIDSQVQDTVEFHCLGGFVLKMLYDLPRPTSDVDVIELVPTASTFLLELAGEFSPMRKKYNVYLDSVTIAPYPYEYESRLQVMFPGAFQNLRLFALDPYDIVLSKIERNIQRDRDDVKYLAGKLNMDMDLLRMRFEQELKPNLGNPERESNTLRLWIEMIEEDRRQLES